MWSKNSTSSIGIGRYFLKAAVMCVWAAGTGLATMPLSETALTIRHQMPGQIKTETSFPEAYEGLSRASCRPVYS